MNAWRITAAGARPPGPALRRYYLAGVTSVRECIER